MKKNTFVGGGNYNEKSSIGFDEYCSRVKGMIDGGFTGA
tara:strand:+ start:91514 stop:91630 length:117 start_codon:yes stop_codon:yes gene_type:complete